MIVHFSPEDLFHQIQNSLWLVRSGLEIEKGDAGSESDSQTVIRKEFDHLYDLFHHLSYLVLLKHSRDPQKADLESVCPNSFARQVFEIFSLQATDYEFSYQDDLPQSLMVKTNPFWARELLYVFVDNAFKHTPVGNRIEFRLELVDEERVAVKVCNFGVGISQEDMAKVWEKHTSLNVETCGLGLGLGVAQTIADHLGVVLDLDSDGESYTRFTALFPIIS